MLYGPVLYIRRVFIQIDFNYEAGSNGILLWSARILYHFHCGGISVKTLISGCIIWMCNCFRKIPLDIFPIHMLTA